MTRRNISLPDALDERARAAKLNVSALAQRAIEEELERLDRIAHLDQWLSDLDEEHGPLSPEDLATADEWWASAIPAAEFAPRSPRRRKAAS